MLSVAVVISIVKVNIYISRDEHKIIQTRSLQPSIANGNSGQKTSNFKVYILFPK